MRKQHPRPERICIIMTDEQWHALSNLVNLGMNHLPEIEPSDPLTYGDAFATFNDSVLTRID